MNRNNVYRKYVLDEMSKNKEYNIIDLENLVNSFSDEQIKQLCKYYSDYRKNSVFDFISRGPDNWKEDNIDISNIDVGKINIGINGYLGENSWSLKKIAKDKRICQHNEFKSQGDIHPKIASFIAKKANHRYIIVDGMHRIIRLSYDGKRRFKLIYYYY